MNTPATMRLPPHDANLEKAVIGALLIEQSAYAIVCDIISPQSFYDSRHKVIYGSVCRLAADNNPVDLLTVNDDLRDHKELEAAGDTPYLMELAGMVVSTAHLEFHARIVAQKARARHLIDYANGILTEAYEGDIDELMQKAEGELFELSREKTKKDYTQINPVIRDAFDQIQAAAAQPEGLSGVPSGFTDLDKMTCGWQKSDLVIIAARPAMGKTAFALSLAKNIGADRNLPVAIFSLEMSNVQLVNRMLMNVCELNGGVLKSGHLRVAEWEKLDRNAKQLIDKPIYIDDTPSLSVFELRTKARRLVREHNVKLIIIDYLQLMNAAGMKFNSRQEEVSTISRSLKGLAKELNIPILALSQLNRGVENRGTEGKRPQLSDLRESGAIEQDADIVVLLHRPEYYKIYQDEQGHDLRGKAEVIIAKHRNGAVGSVLLNFRGEFARFENVNECKNNNAPF